MNYSDELNKNVESFRNSFQKQELFAEQLRAFVKMNLTIPEIYNLTKCSRSKCEKLTTRKKLPSSTNDILKTFGFEEIDREHPDTIPAEVYRILVEATNAKRYLLETVAAAKQTDIREVSHLVHKIKAGQQVLQDYGPFFPDVIHSLWNERELVLDIRYVIEKEHDGRCDCNVQVALPDWAQLTFCLEPIQFDFSSDKVPGSDDWCNELWDNFLYSELLDQVQVLYQDIQKTADLDPENVFSELNLELLNDLMERIKWDGRLDRLEAIELEETNTFLHALLLGFLLLDGRDDEALNARKDKFLAQKLLTEYGLADI